MPRPAQLSSAPIIPREPNFPRGPPLGVLAYRVWVTVLQAPSWGCPTIVGGLPPPTPWGRPPPSPRGQNYRPYLPIIPISPLLYAHPRGDGAGSAAASTPSLVPSPVIPSGVIRSICRNLIYFVVVFVVFVVVFALEISMLHTLYHQLSTPNQKIVMVAPA